MSKNACTRPASGLNRRHVLTAGAAVAAAASVPVLAVAADRPSPSPELLRWRNARAAYWSACAREHAWFAVQWKQNRASFPSDDALVDAILNMSEYLPLSRQSEEAEAALNASVDVIMARPVRSWHDVAELAEMVRGEHRWFPGERHPDDDFAPSSDVTALFDAIAAMAAKEGGGHV